MNELDIRNSERETAVAPVLSHENTLEISEEIIRKKYLTRLSEMEIVSSKRIPEIEEDLIDNIRLYKITEMVYKKGEPVIDKLTTVFNTLSTYRATVFILLDSDGQKTEFYVGVRNNEEDENLKRSSVIIGDTLRSTLVGHFPGIRIRNVDRKQIRALSKKICRQDNAASVSVVGSPKTEKTQTNEEYVQGLEKLMLAMQGRQYIGLILAKSEDSQTVQRIRKDYQDLYTKLSLFQKVQFSESRSESQSRTQSFFEMDSMHKAAALAGPAVSFIGASGGALVGNAAGAMIGGHIAGQLTSFLNSLVPQIQASSSISYSDTKTIENKTVTGLLQLIDEALIRTHDFDSYGMWSAAAYFVSEEMSSAEIAASNYRSLMNGEKSGRQVSAINSWRRKDASIRGDYSDMTAYLSRFMHPQFVFAKSEKGPIPTSASVIISGKELGLHLGFPRATVPGLPVIEHAEFGKEVITYGKDIEDLNPGERITLGRVFDLGQITDTLVELNNQSLSMHTFITGSTGSGKSNTVYQMLTELHQDGIPFLVVEPAKGEYKDVFGSWPDVRVFSTNPKVADLIHINPFRFPDSIHVLEHVDGLVEIFSVCWPMYDAMPAFFKDAILKSYEAVGWDLGSSTFDGDDLEYPDFEILAEQLDRLIEGSDYASDIKSNYRGALITRVKSLTVGLNRYMFTSEQTPYEVLFDQNCILDISRIKSTETKALIMGLMVYILNEYRADQKKGSNSSLKHVTVLEEAHNILKNTKGTSSELVGKSVEILTQTIAEIRTYGEGFIIVDQSPSSVDIAAIKNTNTKIVLRTPEANDREAVGRSVGLSPDQVNEIAKLPSGVAVVYQNDWVTPVLTKIYEKQIEKSTYNGGNHTEIQTKRQARIRILRMLLQTRRGKDKMRESELLGALRVLDLNRNTRKEIGRIIKVYLRQNGRLGWNPEEMERLRKLVMAVLEMTDKDYATLENHEDLKREVGSKLSQASQEEIHLIYRILVNKKEVGENGVG